MTSTLVDLSARCLNLGLALLGLGVLWASALFVGAPLGPLWACLLLISAGTAISLWAVECQHRLRMATSAGRLDNLADRIQALCEFAAGLGLEDVREVVLKPGDFDLVVESAIAEGLVARPQFVVEGWRPETVDVLGITCRRGHDSGAPDDSELSGC